ncbi:MAG: polyphosphate:AMP phosphotransferase [Gammaproteobacteria bacterium]
MFDTAELGQSVPKAEFKERERALRGELLELQYRTLEFARFPLLVDFAGVDGAGKSTTVNILNKWLDPRWVRTIGYREPSAEARARPRFWRYWRDLPPKGRTGLFLSGRYSRPLLKRVYGEIDEAAFDDRLGEIIRFETALADDGVLLLKFWMHLSRDRQTERLEALAADPARSYMVSEQDWKNHDNYESFVAVAERIITRTNRASAPWYIVEGVDENFRHLRVGEVLATELRRHLEQQERLAAAERDHEAHREAAADGGPESARRVTVLDRLDLSLSVPRKTYKKRLKKRQLRLGELARQATAEGLSTVLVFEGPDAAGKGGAIRRTVWGLDARTCRVHQFAAPTEEERAHHYLWRFWRRLPRAGHVAIFDRSWYGRVLVERTEGFATEDEWRRAYNEINDFEWQMTDRGMLLMKFWLHVSKEEQLKRFRERAESAYKHWKLTDEDWRNRERWDDYEMAAHDMIQYTSTQTAPWILVEAEDKHYARLKVIESVCDHLEEKLG